MRILGIDPGLVHTGWGVVEIFSAGQVSYVACGVIKPFVKLPFFTRLKIIYSEVTALISTYTPDEVAVEEVFVNMNPSSSKKLIMARTAALMACVNNGLPINEFAPNTIKKSVTGNGHAQKSQIHTMVEKILRISINEDNSQITHDSLDALAVALTAS